MLHSCQSQQKGEVPLAGSAYAVGQNEVQDPSSTTSRRCWVPGALCTPQHEAPSFTPWRPASESDTDDSVPQQQQYIQ